MKRKMWSLGMLLVVACWTPMAFAAYHHEGENDSDNFLDVYAEKTGTKLDHCALCHSGGSYVNSKGKTVVLGSCQWCHYTYGYDGSGDISDTMNPYGLDYLNSGRDSGAIQAIDGLDSDSDGFVNQNEITANRFPGDASDYPGLATAPHRIYTKAQLEAMTQHTQFLLMNTSRSGDFYGEYTGVLMEDLLDDVWILNSATGISVYAPDGWAQYHPLAEEPDPELYHVNGTYPQASYQYDPEADESLGGWCDYSAPSCAGRTHNEPIIVPGGLKMILAYKREGVDLDPGLLNAENKLDGEGPFRVVPPQRAPCPPDQRSSDSNDTLIWPYNEDWDHNAGASTRTVTIIKVQPLPPGTTDINVYEAGWSYVDQEKIVIYGAIDGTDSNGNGVLDSEEGTDPNSDFDTDGTPDYQDSDTARVRHAKGVDTVLLHTSNGNFVEMEALSDDDPAVSQTNKPSSDLPYGTFKFKIVGLNAGEQVTVTLVFPDNVPTNAKYYKIHPIHGWREIPVGSNDGDNTITIALTDGDPLTDSDGNDDGTIIDPGALALPATAAVSGSSGSEGGGGGGCFIVSAARSLSW